MLLKTGSNGDEVKKVQAKLGLDADGIFGVKTALAVKAWQADHGLTVDGLVGPNTWAKMFPDTAIDSNVSAGAATADDAMLNKLTGAVPDVVVEQLPDCAKLFQIDSQLRLAHFLAQCSHESAGFTVKKENLNYSAVGLMKIFPKYFTEELAERYARQPEKIASRVYGGRMGNGDEASQDGFKYRGRGYIQLTGKNNYQAFGDVVHENVVTNPDWVADKFPLLSAAWFWNSKSLNSLADHGSGDEVVTDITRKVNGGTNGLEDRISRFKTFFSLLS